MNASDVLAELDIAVSQTNRAIRTGNIPDNDYAHGLLDGPHVFRRFIRSEQYARFLRAKNKTPTTEKATNAPRP